MSLKREMLVDAGITDKELLDKLMQAYGAGVENARAQVKSELQAETDTLKEQLQAQTDKLTELTSDQSTSEELKKALEELKNEYATFKSDSESKLATVQKNNAIALALKDSNTVDVDVLMSLIDLDSVELDKDSGKPMLDDILNNLQETKPYLFVQEQSEKTPTITVGGNPDGTGQVNTDPFQNIIDNYAK